MNNKHSIIVLLAYYDPFWISFLQSEGIAWRLLKSKELVKDSKISILVIPKKTKKKVFNMCLSFMQDGLSLIVESGLEESIYLDSKDVHRIAMPYDNRDFSGLTNATTNNSIKIKHTRVGKGSLFALPFRLSSLLGNWDKTKHYISIGNGNNIFEVMSSIVKKNVRRVVIEVLKQAFFSQGLPFIHKWYYPGKNRSVFCYRGDADGGSQENFKAWLKIVKSYADATSVFFCTSQYLKKQELIADAAKSGLEIGSHNHWHIVFPDRITNARSLKKSEKIISEFADRPKGFVAPAYFWHPSLYQLLEEKGYLYSSAFRINHDGLPYYPVVDGKICNVLEMPFHCLGDRFPVSGIPLESEITFSFFKKLIKKKYNAGEPLFLYGHPDVDGRMGNAPTLLKTIFESVLSFSDVKPWQMSSYAVWWQKRNDVELVGSYDISTSKLQITKDAICGQFPVDLMLRVEFADGKTFLVDPKNCTSEGLKKEDMTYFSPLELPHATDIGEVVYTGPVMNQTHSFLSWQNRNKIKRYIKAYKKVYLDHLF